MSTSLATWILHVGEECELCDRAVEILAEVHFPDFECHSIETDAELASRYGERVPVLCHVRSGRELGWPFDADMVRNFLGACERD